MRIAVIGCGAVGSLFAANLGTLDDVEVWAYDPWQEHVDAINANGLRLSGAGEVVGRVRATADPKELPPCELGIVATKSQHTSAALAATAHAFEHGSGPNIDNLEAEDQRFLQPGHLFSIEPGVYMEDCGLRTEINCLIVAGGCEVTTLPLQKEIIPLE